MRSRILPTVVVAAAVAASAGFAAPAFAAPPPAGSPGARSGHGGGNQHSVDAHLRKELKKAAKAAGAVVDTGAPTTGRLGAPQGSYSLTSSSYSMGKFGDSPAVLASCGTGYYVDFSIVSPPSGPSVYVLNVTVNSSSDFVTSAVGYPDTWNQVGSDADGNPEYQGLFMKLSNDNPFSSNTGSFTWTCDPLGS